MRILIFLLFLLPLSLIGQVESQFNGTLNVFSGSRIGSTNTFTISGIFSSTTTSYTSSQSDTGDIVQVQSGSRFYWMHIYSIASNAGGVITCNVRDSSSTLTTFPLGKWSIFRPTTNLRLPLSPDGETNASRSSTFNTLALRVDEIQTAVASATNCEQTFTKASHGFRKGTPVFWNGSTYIRPTADSLVPDFVVVDSLTVNTFKVANCGTYTTALANGLYWFTSASPGYSLTADTTKVPLFQALNGKLILNPIVGFNLMAAGDVTSDILADTAAAIRADFPNGIISALPLGNVTIASTNSLNLKEGSVRIKSSTAATTSILGEGFIRLLKGSSGRFGGNFFINDTTGVVDNSFYLGQDDDGSIQSLGSGPQITHTFNNIKLPGQFRWAYAVRADTSMPIGVIRIVQGDRYASTTVPVTHRFYAGLQATETDPGYYFLSDASSGKLAFRVTSSLFIRQGGKIYFGSDSTFAFDPANDLLQLSAYGTTATTAATLAKTESGYVASFATDGTMLSRAANTERYNTITSTTSPQTLSSTIADNLINQGGTQGTFTFRLPASPVDGQISKATFANTVTVLTIDGNGTAVTGTLPTTVALGTQIIFKNYTGVGWVRQL